MPEIINWYQENYTIISLCIYRGKDETENVLSAESDMGESPDSEDEETDEPTSVAEVSSEDEEHDESTESEEESVSEEDSKD